MESCSSNSGDIQTNTDEEKKGEGTKYIRLAGTYPLIEIAPQGVMVQELMEEGKSVFLMLLKVDRIGF